MVTLLIIADDFTGALDTGVQFAASGANTRVVTNASYDLCQLDPSVQVLVIDAETRHLAPQKAYDIVYDITRRAVDLNIPYLYKKTDSALRGNIGSELTAMIDAARGKTLSFLPAFPKMKRWTKEGIHYIDGVPVDESVFGKDPFEPVTCSHVPTIIEMQSQVKVNVETIGKQSIREKKITEENIKESEIIVWDAETDNELEKVGLHLHETGQMYLTAGCAGFAAVLPKLLGFKGVRKQEQKQEKNLISKLLVISGSVNPITVDQLDYGEKQGLHRFRLNLDEMLRRDFWTSPSGQQKIDNWRTLLEETSCIILDSNDMTGRMSTDNDRKDNDRKGNGLSFDEICVQIARSYGCILRSLIEGGLESTIMIIGGDTLLGCMEELNVKEMEPICELASGVVLSEFFLGNKKSQVISKSGGFGRETLIAELAQKIIGTT